MWLDFHFTTPIGYNKKPKSKKRSRPKTIPIIHKGNFGRWALEKLRITKPDTNNNLSAIGSRKFPSSLRCLNRLAIYPSIPSLTEATQNVITAVHQLISAPDSEKSKRAITNTGTIIIRKIDM